MTDNLNCYDRHGNTKTPEFICPNCHRDLFNHLLGIFNLHVKGCKELNPK